MKPNKISRQFIEELIEKSNFDKDNSLVDFMENSFSELEKMTSKLLQSEFTIKANSDLVLKETPITLRDISKVNNFVAKEEKILSNSETYFLMEKNCQLKGKKVLYKKK